MSEIRALGERAKRASRTVGLLDGAAKDAALHLASARLGEASSSILAANEADVVAAQGAGTSATVVDRLRLNAARIEAMATGLRQVAALPDPVGEVVAGWRRPNGLLIEQVRVPLGVVAIVYENRPNVTSDAFGLCLKSSNACLLRGSSGALRSNMAIVEVLRGALEEASIDPDGLLLVENTSYEAAREFMQLEGLIDVLIPRGGPSLLTAVRENATVPYVIDGDGNCHVYVDSSADLDMAESIVVNAKTHRTSVCNAAESLLVHRDVAAEFLPRVAKALDGVELVGDAQSCAIVGARMGVATDEDFATEFLDMKMSVAVVASLDAAIAHIDRYGSGHTEAIVTRDVAAAQRFTREVDAAAVVVNASTRFTDGEQFGFGAEIGISTQKLHARGPMGLRELTTVKYVVHGSGHIRP